MRNEQIKARNSSLELLQDNKYNFSITLLTLIIMEGLYNEFNL